MEALPGKARARYRGEAIALKLGEGITFAEAVKRMKEKAKDQAEGVRKIRRALNGDLLVEFMEGAGVREFFGKINGKLGSEVAARRLRREVEVEIRDVDPTVEEGELLEKIAEKVKGEVDDIKIKTLRIARGGMKFAVVTMEETLAEELRKAQAIKIGWAIAKARIVPKVTRCYKCHGFGHMAGKCKNGPDSKETCRRCGSEEHKMQACREDPRCSLCVAGGRKGAEVVHIAGSIRRPAYKEEIEKLEKNGRTLR